MLDSVRGGNGGSSTGVAAPRPLQWYDEPVLGVPSVGRVCDLSQIGGCSCTRRVLRNGPCTCRAHSAGLNRRSTSGFRAYCEGACQESATCRTTDSQWSQESGRRSTRRSDGACVPVVVREAAARRRHCPSIEGDANGSAYVDVPFLLRGDALNPVVTLLSPMLPDRNRIGPIRPAAPK
jgi:hypothetical protein